MKALTDVGLTSKSFRSMGRSGRISFLFVRLLIVNLDEQVWGVMNVDCRSDYEFDSDAFVMNSSSMCHIPRIAI